MRKEAQKRECSSSRNKAILWSLQTRLPPLITSPLPFSSYLRLFPLPIFRSMPGMRKTSVLTFFFPSWSNFLLRLNFQSTFFFFSLHLAYRPRRLFQEPLGWPHTWWCRRKFYSDRNLVHATLSVFHFS